MEIKDIKKPLELAHVRHLQRLYEKGDNQFNPLSWIVGEPKIGKGTWIGAFCLIDGLGGLEIGENCNISSGAHIITHSTAARCVTGVGEMYKSPTVIKNRVFIGENATILMGCRIGNQCMIGAASLVLEGTIIPDHCVVVGSPVRFVRRMSPDALVKGYTNMCRCKPTRLFDLTSWEILCKEHERDEY